MCIEHNSQAFWIPSTISFTVYSLIDWCIAFLKCSWPLWKCWTCHTKQGVVHRAGPEESSILHPGTHRGQRRASWPRAPAPAPPPAAARPHSHKHWPGTRRSRPLRPARRRLSRAQKDAKNEIYGVCFPRSKIPGKSESNKPNLPPLPRLPPHKDSNNKTAAKIPFNSTHPVSMNKRKA